MKSFVVLVSIAALSVVLVACGGGAAEPAPQPTTPPAVAPAPPAPPVTAPAPVEPASPPSSGGTVVSLQDPGGSGEYIFDPAEFTFSVGETVTFELTSETEYHTFTVDDLGIDVEVEREETQTLTFTFEEAGEFALVCIPHEFLGMVGTITVQ